MMAPVNVVGPHLLLASAVQSPISTFQAIVLGLLQGVTELFPVSSLGHTVLFPTLFGWHRLVVMQSQTESPWLAFVVMLHVGSAIGLLIYFWRDWISIVRAFFHTLATRRVETSTERLAWLIIAASIPTGILGIVFEHQARVLIGVDRRGEFFRQRCGFGFAVRQRLAPEHGEEPRARSPDFRRLRTFL